MQRVCFVIRSLDHGGTERQLVQLARGLDKARFSVGVITIYGGGALLPELEAAEGVRVWSLDKRSRWDVVPFLWRLPRLVLRERPDVIHGYLPLPNLLALAAGKLAGRKVVWGLRASKAEQAQYGRLEARLLRLGRWLSPLADLIVVNSEAGRRDYAGQGFATKRMVVIQNGIDAHRFVPRPELRASTRRQWGVPADAKVVGLVARLDPMKGHETFLRAASWLAAAIPEARFVCAGGGPSALLQELRARVESAGITDRVVWAGDVDDMVAVYSGLDIAVSASSYGEGFSNSVGEAMACGVPCVVTDVGDSAAIVGETGRVVPPRDAPAMAAAVTELLAMGRSGRQALGARARRRIECEFSLERMVRRTEEALLGVVAGSHAHVP